MSSFTPFGKGHIALSCAAKGGVSARDIRRALAWPASKDRKSWALIENLRVERLLSRRVDGFHLTRLGTEVLNELREQRPVVVEFGEIVEGVGA